MSPPMARLAPTTSRRVLWPEPSSFLNASLDALETNAGDPPRVTQKPRQFLGGASKHEGTLASSPLPAAPVTQATSEESSTQAKPPDELEPLLDRSEPDQPKPIETRQPASVVPDQQWTKGLSLRKRDALKRARVASAKNVPAAAERDSPTAVNAPRFEAQVHKPLPATPKRVATAAIGRRVPKLSVRVSNRTPRKGRGIRIAVQFPEGVSLTGAPVLRMVDANGAEYRSMMKPGDQMGEWVWTSGLDVVGPWSGRVKARWGKQFLTTDLPPITVKP